ncbi:anaphase promoting complex subunit CDC27 NDAI_0E04040 [Naumovozyma dairenensis CBS 421]|uniref:Uncharacterized protein n=1 Tax=Naumovozyma dairenensis (strain ATCC 10597 / BCRC 20456 / CBS 421 / NBRC 0211 / NRRL Y-12639) TaxID=1071378 RepID=G0WBV1_NAUDC|nr:hypothetical protein NDAI_0E04040 [Naumovozyma dairenensis CBS 421]CCD25221.1 hypothetical protein NDAI_0E04040 [Naumovozyma dairenensis CBS 421]
MLFQPELGAVPRPNISSTNDPTVNTDETGPSSTWKKPSVSFLNGDTFIPSSAVLFLSETSMLKLEEVIEHAIEQLNYDTAEFYAELLFAQCSNLENSNIHKIKSIYLYTLALFLNQNYHTSMHVSKDYKHSDIGIAYLYGKCALKLSRKIKEAIDSLVRLKGVFNGNSNAENVQLFPLIHFPNVATIDCLIAKLYSKLDRKHESSLFHSGALNQDPYLWESYTELCKMKVSIDIKALFMGTSQKSSNLRPKKSNRIVKSTVSSSSSTSSLSLSLLHKGSNNIPTVEVTPFNISAPWYNEVPESSINNLNRNLNISRISPARHGKVNDPKNIADGWPTISRNANNLNNNNNNINNESSPGTQRGSSIFSAKQPTSPSVKQPTISSLAKINSNRNRLLTTPPSKLNSNHDQRARYKTLKNISYNTSSNNANMSSTIRKKLLLESDNPNGNMFDAQNDEPLNNLLYSFALILKTSSQYNSYKAIRLINSLLPTHIRDEMPWCQSQLGMLHFEIVNYEMSLKYFEKLRKLQPTRLKDLETYSTLLWHLHDKIKLTVLSNELLKEFKNEPQTWCCLGNLFSLQKDHKEAIKAFEKVTKLDPTFTYGYTLQAHEYLSDDSFDLAKNYFRKAVSTDSQHYNAYYGIGMCSMKLGEFEHALLYFEKARSINPSNVILICCCGVAFEKLSYPEKALSYYELACQVQPSSSLAKFKRAHLLYSMANYPLALECFEELTKLAPEEATVHFILGQLYNIMGRKKDAVKEYTIAMNLDPKGNQVILEALEKCHEQE